MRRLILAVSLSVAVMVQIPAAVSAAADTRWDHLGNGGAPGVSALNGAVYALNTDAPGLLYAGGVFTDAGGHANADHIARWDGLSWSALGPVTLNGAVNAIATHAGKVYVGGQFTDVGGNPNLDYLAVWNGSAWSSPCNTVHAITGSVQALQILGNTLYIGGSFANGAGLLAADFLLACDLTTGAPRGTVAHDGDINSGISALAADSNGTLYAGGAFLDIAGIPQADHVAAYDGTWHAMGAGPPPAFGIVEGLVRSLTAHGTDVYVGTDVVNIDGIAQADHLARWDASTLTWHAVGSNVAGTDGWLPASAFIYSMTASAGSLFIGGSFQNAGGKATADSIAMFDGSKWRPIGSDGVGNGPLDETVSALTTYRHALVAGGNFTNAGGDPKADAAAKIELQQPDLMIGASPSGPFNGSNSYSYPEQKTITVARGHSATFYVRVQNDGLVADDFRMDIGTGAAGFKVTAFSGSTDVTSQMLLGTYHTGTLAPNAHLTFRVVVKVSPTAVANRSGFDMSAASWRADLVFGWVQVT